MTRQPQCRHRSRRKKLRRDPAAGDFRETTVLRKFGDVPDDLSAL
jgi:hypothetical protein